MSKSQLLKISFECKHCFKEWENLRQHNIIVVKFNTIMSQKKISRINLKQTSRNVRNVKKEDYRDMGICRENLIVEYFIGLHYTYDTLFILKVMFAWISPSSKWLFWSPHIVLNVSWECGSDLRWIYLIILLICIPSHLSNVLYHKWETVNWSVSQVTETNCKKLVK